MGVGDTQEKVQRGGDSAAVTETEGHAECVVVGVVNGGGAGGGAAPPSAHMQENVCVCVCLHLALRSLGELPEHFQMLTL